MHFISKGKYGYIRSEKKKRFLISAGLLIIPLFIYIMGVVVNGTNATLISVIAVVGLLPACRAIVSLITMLLRQPMSEADHDKIVPHTGDLMMAYELYMTEYEKNTMVDALAICGNTIVGYVTDAKTDIAFGEKHITNILRSNGYPSKVSLLRDIDKFTERLDSMNAHAETLRTGIRYTPNPTYPDLSLEELIYQTLLAISL